MAWKMEPCPRCRGPKATVAKLCRTCYGETSNSPTCPRCGGKKSYDAMRCRACQGAEGKSHKPCPNCGTRIQRAATQCRSCYDKTRELKRYYCADCGQPTKQYASTRYAERCRACNTRYRRSLVPKACSVEGCPRPHQAKGLCPVHYAQAHQRRPKGLFRHSLPKTYLASWPCQLCGYDRVKSDVHRLHPGKDGGTYVPGNMVALCKRCHYEVHQGVTLPPPAPTEEEIVAAEVRRRLA